MAHIVILLLPLLAIAQFPHNMDKPPLCSCGQGRHAEFWHFASLDAESLHSYDQLELNLNLIAENWNTPLQGTATITLVALEALTSIPLNAQNLDVTSVRVSGVASAFANAQDTLRVLRAVAVSETVSVAVDYTAFAVNEGFATGFHNAWEHVYTFSEPYGARQWYPCWDQPYDKFSHVTIAVNIPEQWSLAANGVLTGYEPHEPGRRLEIYQHDRPISSYLLMIAAGNFSRQIFQENGIQYRYFAWPRSDSAKAAYDWERTPQMVSYFSTLFGAYPFEEYGMVMADIFGGWGAMEHQTFTTYGFHLVDSLRTFEGIVAHELAHQWFGDHLSPVDFRNMWLNEGFATYGNALWTEFASGEEAFYIDMQNAATACFTEERDLPSYSVYDPPPDRLFGANIYFKGAWVLHMLRKQLLGDSLFFAVMQDYVITFGGGNVDTEDFIAVVNEHYDGPDLDWFFDQWVYGLHYPKLIVTLAEVSGQEDTWRVAITQGQQSWDELFRFPLRVNYDSDAGGQSVEIWVEGRTLIQDFSAPGIRNVNISGLQDLLHEATWVNVDEPGPPIPAEFSVGPAYPNPFNPSLTIPIEVRRAARIDVKLHDVAGRLAAALFEGTVEMGRHSLSYQAPAELSSGVYVVTVSGNAGRHSQKVLLLK